MKALQYDHHEVPREALKLRELLMPAPGPGALRLRIAYGRLYQVLVHRLAGLA